MSTGKDPEQNPRRRAHRRAQPITPANINPPATKTTPTDRLDSMTQAHIDEVCNDKDYYRRKCDELQRELDRLLPETAQLREQVKATGVLEVVSLVLISLGGGAISYATFSQQVSHLVANFGLAVLLSGIVVQLGLYIYRFTSR